MAAKDRQVGGEHYQRKLQPWDIIDEYGLDFYEGNAIKYILRWKGNRAEDLKKAIHYLEKELELIEVEDNEFYDVSDQIFNIDPTDTPFQSALNTASMEPTDAYETVKYNQWFTHTCCNCGKTYVVSPSVQHCPSCSAHVTYSPL